MTLYVNTRASTMSFMADDLRFNFEYLLWVTNLRLETKTFTPSKQRFRQLETNERTIKIV